MVLCLATCSFDDSTAYGRISGLDDPSMGWARYAQASAYVQVLVRVYARACMDVCLCSLKHMCKCTHLHPRKHGTGVFLVWGLVGGSHVHFRWTLCVVPLLKTCSAYMRITASRSFLVFETGLFILFH